MVEQDLLEAGERLRTFTGLLPLPALDTRDPNPRAAMRRMRTVAVAGLAAAALALVLVGFGDERSEDQRFATHVVDNEPQVRLEATAFPVLDRDYGGTNQFALTAIEADAPIVTVAVIDNPDMSFTGSTPPDGFSRCGYIPLPDRTPDNSGSFSGETGSCVEQGGTAPAIATSRGNEPGTGFVMWQNVPPEAAFVVFESGTHHVWERPVNGVALFPWADDAPSTIRLIALDNHRNVIGSTEKTHTEP